MAPDLLVAEIGNAVIETEKQLQRKQRLENRRLADYARRYDAFALIPGTTRPRRGSGSTASSKDIQTC